MGSPFVVWYDWQDDDFGLVDNQGNERPAFKVAKMLFGQLKDCEITKIRQVGSAWTHR